MVEYVEREATCKYCVHDGVCYLQEVCNDIEQQLNDFGCDDFKPTADVVPMGAYKQILWERNLAMEQLKEHGIPFGGKADVVGVVRCKDCDMYLDRNEMCNEDQPEDRGYCKDTALYVLPTDYCSYGKRKTD